MQSFQRTCPALAALSLLFVFGLLPRAARAQACHDVPLRQSPHGTVRLEGSAIAASYEAAHHEGEYQGGSLLLAYSHGWLVAQASASAYRITRNGQPERGLGDVQLGARASAFTTRRGALELSLGPQFDATLPSGDADKGLGMGHAMLMPGAFVRLALSRLTLHVQLAYGRALSHDTHTHGHAHGPAPLVNPMNRSEIEHAVGARLALAPVFYVLLRVAGAVPVADAQGEVREALALGGELVFGPFDLALEQQVPLAGEPFRARGVLRAGVQW